VTDNDDTMNPATTAGAADDDTTVVPDIHPTQAAPELAWSHEDETEELSERRLWRTVWRDAGIVFGAAAIVAGAITVGWLKHPVNHQTGISAPPRPPLPKFDGTYKLEAVLAKGTYRSKTPPHPDDSAPEVSWWAFRSACNPGGCAATSTQLDAADHERRHPSGRTFTFRFADGKWQQLPADRQIECVLHDPGSGAETAQSTSTLTPQSDGVLTGAYTSTIISDQCGLLGTVTTVPMTATRTGDAPPFAVPAPAAYPAAPIMAVVPLLPVQVPDPRDLLFISKLADHGIPTSDFVHGSTGTSTAGRTTCDLIAQGRTIDELVDAMRTDREVMTLTTDQANFVVHAAIDVYCPTAGH
jgi:hypothetical protein